jgi:hypothetical protein
MLFKPRTLDEVCVHAQYLESIDQRRGNQVGLSRKSMRNLPRRGQRSGNGARKRRQKPIHISANIPSTTAIIKTLMATLRKNVGNYIHI